MHIFSVEEIDPLVVRFVDFGNLDIIDDQNIFRLNDSLLGIQHQAVHCKLRGLEAIASDPSSIVINTEKRQQWLQILHAGKLIAIFHSNVSRSSLEDPPYEVDLVTKFNVASYIVNNKLVTFSTSPITKFI
jgi:hypothetical protein